MSAATRIVVAERAHTASVGRNSVDRRPAEAAPVRVADLYSWASALTALRLGIAVVLPLTAGTPWLLGLYLVALATDVLDGEVARRTRSCSRAGAMFDGWVDKILHVNLAWTLGATDRVPDWWLLLWFSREILQLPMFFLLLADFRLSRAPPPRTNLAGRITAFAVAIAMIGAMLGVRLDLATWVAGGAGVVATWMYGRVYLINRRALRASSAAPGEARGVLGLE